MYHQTVVHLPVPRRDCGHLLSEIGLVVLDSPAWSPRLLQRQNEGGLARRSLHLNSLFLHQRAAKLIFVVVVAAAPRLVASTLDSYFEDGTKMWCLDRTKLAT